MVPTGSVRDPTTIRKRYGSRRPGKTPPWATGRGETPDVTLLHYTAILDFIYTPIISSIPLELSGLIAFGTKVYIAFVFGGTRIGVLYGIIVRTEVELM